MQFLREEDDSKSERRKRYWHGEQCGVLSLEEHHKSETVEKSESCMWLWVPWTWGAFSFPMLGSFSVVSISSDIFQAFSFSYPPGSLSYPSGNPVMQMLVNFMLSQRLSSFLFILFSSFCSVTVNSTTLSSSFELQDDSSLSRQLYCNLWPLLSFPNLLAYWVHHFHSIIF